MESITMTNATQVERFRSVCPQVASGRLIAQISGVRQGTTVSGDWTVMPVALGAPIKGITASTFGFGSTLAPTYAQQFTSTDVAHLRSGRPPV